MPQVPVYDGTQVRSNTLQPVPQREIDVSSGMRTAAQALGGISDMADKFVQRDAETEAWQAQASINDSFLKWTAEARKVRQGANAKGYTDEVSAWWDTAKREQFSKLSPLAQQAAAKALTQTRLASLESAAGYENQQLDIGERSALQGAVSSFVNTAVAAGPDKASVHLTLMADALRTYGAKKGINVEPEILKNTTGVHTTIINTMMQRDPKAAELYFNTNKKEIDASQWDNITGRLNQISASTDGEAKADEIWAANVKAGDYKNPLDTFAMDKAAGAAFPNDPVRAKAARQRLNEMAAQWNKAQAEQAAAGVNQVYKLIDSGLPMSRVMRSEAWQGLPGDRQHAITLQLEQQAAARENRAAARENRAAAQDARALTKMQRDERLTLLQNGDQYLTYGPEKLASMSREAVAALRPTFGLEATKHLLDRFDALQKPGKMVEARMDKQDFDQIADTLGLKPFAKDTSEEHKRMLGTLQYRVEQMIDVAQRAKGKELTREEKGKLMREEMARKVTVDPGMLSYNKDVPVILLKPEDVDRVKVPAADRAQIAEALKIMSQRDPNNPLYAPTEENMRRMYLANTSRAASLIPAKK